MFTFYCVTRVFHEGNLRPFRPSKILFITAGIRSVILHPNLLDFPRQSLGGFSSKIRKAAAGSTRQTYNQWDSEKSKVLDVVITIKMDFEVGKVLKFIILACLFTFFMSASQISRIFWVKVFIVIRKRKNCSFQRKKPHVVHSFWLEVMMIWLNGYFYENKNSNPLFHEIYTVL